MPRTGIARFKSIYPKASMPPEADRPTACENADDKEIWFPEPSDRDAEDQAKALCRRCHLRTACLEFALVTRQEHGIWGAKNPNERARILRRVQEIHRVQAQNGGPR